MEDIKCRSQFSICNSGGGFISMIIARTQRSYLIKAKKNVKKQIRCSEKNTQHGALFALLLEILQNQ